LAGRLTFWYSLSAFALILGATAFLYWALITNLDREDDQLLMDKVHLFQAIIRDNPGDWAEVEREIDQESMARQYGQLYVRILALDGQLIRETQGMSQELPPDRFEAAGLDGTDPERGAEIETRQGRSFRIVAAMTEKQTSHDQAYVVQVGMDRSHEEKLLAGYRRYLWIALGTALVLCAFVGHQIAHRGLRPIAEITGTARRIRSTTLDERIRTRGLPSELYELGIKFNEMLDRLEHSFQQLAQFSADIAHELRTPVNNLRGEAEVALGAPRSPEDYREALSSCLEECGRLSRLIDSLLFLARAENPQVQIHKEKLDVGTELTAIKEFYEAAATDAGVALRVKTAGSVLVDIDRTLFQRAIGNLVTNALAHTKPGGAITLETNGTGHETRVGVSDTGCGIAKNHLPHVFDRFYRADPARGNESGNAGLGLAIVKSIAALHQGSVSIESEMGKGTTVWLTFP
jgi:two-component system heavy metal sensor histidine kinase CusS